MGALLKRIGSLRKTMRVPLTPGGQICNCACHRGGHCAAIPCCSAVGQRFNISAICRCPCHTGGAQCAVACCDDAHVPYEPLLPSVVRRTPS